MTRIKQLTGSGTAGLAAQATATGILSNSQTASGATQATATTLASDYTIFTTVSGGAGTILPNNCDSGDWFTIVNHGAGTLIIYAPLSPAGGGTGLISTTQSLQLATLKTANIGCISPSTFWSNVSA